MKNQASQGVSYLLFGVLVIIAVVVIGVVAIISVLFNDNTDIYGTWQNEYKDGNYKFIKKYTFNTDGTGSYEETIYNKGKINDDTKTDLTNVKEKKINRDIEQIIFDNDKYDGNVVYKYKNYLGSFSEVSVQKKKIFDLKIISDGGNSPSILYRKDGTVHFCYDYGNCDNDDCGGLTYKYKLKKNLILLEGDQGWNEFAYIVDDGIFTIGYTKVDDN